MMCSFPDDTSAVFQLLTAHHVICSTVILVLYSWHPSMSISSGPVSSTSIYNTPFLYSKPFCYLLAYFIRRFFRNQSM